MNKARFLKRTFQAGNERGAVLVAGLLVALVLTILSVAAMMSTTTELMIAANDRSAREAFYLAEAGVEDARSRFQATSPFPIIDNQPTNTNWKAFIGTVEKSQQKGFQTANSNHVRFNQLSPPNLNYVVAITHKVNASNQILYWGDGNNDGRPEENTTTGSNIYVITSEGYTSTGATKSVRIECARVPPINAPAAIYTKAATGILGASTVVNGLDSCGTSNKPGIITTATVNQSGNPTITGLPSAIEQNSLMNIDVPYLVNQFKGKADYSYNVNSDTQANRKWGTPTGATEGNPSICGDRNIVHFNTNSTYIKLTGGSSGCGILLVEGNLEVHGGFQWHGVILATGSVSFTGEGGKNVTGAILAGGAVSADLIGGGADIIYCSEAINNQTNNYPLVTLRWVELFG
ncbi:MAG: hypothetical protein FJ117_21255 [Deltaproteobacteria bacterium]|nr:hypothetical protein [Deltaproteobacteria bacterium]